MDVDKQLEQVLVPMVKPVLHFLKIHRKMVFENPAVVVQDVFGEGPETLNAVDVILGLPIHQTFGMGESMVLPQALERVVAPEGVGIVDRALSGLLPDDSHEFFRRSAEERLIMTHNTQINRTVPIFSKRKVVIRKEVARRRNLQSFTQAE